MTSFAKDGRRRAPGKDLAALYKTMDVKLD